MRGEISNVQKNRHNLRRSFGKVFVPAKILYVRKKIQTPYNIILYGGRVVDEKKCEKVLLFSWRVVGEWLLIRACRLRSENGHSIILYIRKRASQVTIATSGTPYTSAVGKLFLKRDGFSQALTENCYIKTCEYIEKLLIFNVQLKTEVEFLFNQLQRLNSDFYNKSFEMENITKSSIYLMY